MRSMKCPGCGFVGWAEEERCKKCGVARGSVPTGESNPASNPQWSQPTYSQHHTSYQGYSQGDLKKGLAITSLVLGIIGFFSFGILLVGAITGVALAALALVKAKQSPQEYGGQGIAMAGLITNVLAVVIVVPIGIIAAIAIPNLLASRMAANEGSSIATLRTIHSAEATFQATVGNGKFGTLDELAANGLIDPRLARGTKNGYRFTVDVTPMRSNQPSTFQAVGVPLQYRSTGRRSFYIDESGVIRAGDNRGAAATERTPPLGDSGYSSSGPSYGDGRPEYSRDY